jgi:hypothetical protein
MKTPHKHAELIKAWADGAEIECWNDSNNKWCEIKMPVWIDMTKYRIKPEPKPDRVVQRWVFSDGSTGYCSQSNVQYTFDGETGQLKAAEVV